MAQTILYIGGFELPDKNAAAQRVVGIAKGLRELGHTVVFLNSLKKCDKMIEPREVEYYGFKCYEYKRENKRDYLLLGDKALEQIEKIQPNAIIAYNYPAIALEKIRRYCKKNNTKCFADTTEWYQAFGNNPIYRIIKNMDTMYRMTRVQKKLDGVIAISRYLYDYYKDEVKTIIIPPIVDMNDKKWGINAHKNDKITTFVYAGSPSAQKERLDLITRAIEQIPSQYPVLLNVVGIDENEFKMMYKWTTPISDRVKFWGRVDHIKAIEIIKQSSWSIILRDNNQVVKAGFPTKLVESISCGTPVIVNDFSNIKEYLDDTNSIMISDFYEINFAVIKAIESPKVIDDSQFDYHRYLEILQVFFPTE